MNIIRAPRPGDDAGACGEPPEPAHASRDGAPRADDRRTRRASIIRVVEFTRGTLL